METTTDTTPTATLTATPSKSRAAGPCWIRIGEHTTGTYLHLGEAVEIEVGTRTTIAAKISDRRNGVDHGRWDVVATGNPDDTIHIVLGSPQAVEADLIGFRAATDTDAPAATPAPATTTAPARAAEMATDKQISYAASLIRRIGSDWRDTDMGQDGSDAPTRTELAAMTRTDISDLITDLRSAY